MRKYKALIVFFLCKERKPKYNYKQDTVYLIQNKKSPRARVEPAIPNFEVQELIQCATELVEVMSNSYSLLHT